MKRIAQTPRPDWLTRLESIGFHFHSLDEDNVPQPVDQHTFVYWREDVAFAFSEQEIETLYAAALELHRLCLAAVEHTRPEDESKVNAGFRHESPSGTAVRRNGLCRAANRDGSSA